GVLKLSLSELFPGGMLGTNLLLSAVAGLPSALLVVAGFEGLLGLAVAALLYGLCYVGLLALTRRLDAQEIEWARRAWGVVAALRRRRARARARDGPSWRWPATAMSDQRH